MEIGAQLPIWSIIPFVGMLLSIAIFPLVKGEWWGSHELHVALFWALLFCIPFGIAFGLHELTYELLEVIVLDYIPFIVLLFGLFVVAGGIAIKGSIAGTTKNNIILLLIGTFLASWIGTTGAAMLLIRPVIRANAWRKSKAHVVVFFIFLVANMGGCLTPLGDPPLFLGYLRGVPFFWTIEHILPILIFNLVILLVVFGLLDRHLAKKEMAEGRSPLDLLDNAKPKEKIHIEGAHNLIFIAMILIAVVLNGTLSGLGETYGFYLFDDIHLGINYFVQIIIILAAAVLSLKTTPKRIREINDFEFGPIKEVAELFIGIFITMIPAIALLHAYGASIGIDTPLKFFWASGALSSFLDNSPTYVVFLTSAGALGAVSGVTTTVGTVAIQNLLAISAGAVFMGANTYIGNAPNFMVKSISESRGVKMPSFFGYMAWSGAILIPVFILDTLVFFL
jgi:Na+/H+ antiporter NhaD/arsenite permease-like protein